MTLSSIFQIFPKMIQNASTIYREYRSKGFLKYWTHYDDHTIIFENSTALMQVIQCKGFLFETATDEEIDIQSTLRNFLYKGMHVDELGVYFHTIRKEGVLYDKNYSPLDFEHGFASFLDKRWSEKWQQNTPFINEHYISIIVNISHRSAYDNPWVSKLMGEKIEKIPIASILTAYDTLKEAVGRVSNSLGKYRPSLLGLKEEHGQIRSEIIEFLGTIANCGEYSRTLLTPGAINNLIQRNRLYFGGRAIEMQQQDGINKFAGIVSIKEYGPKTWPGMLDAFLQQPFEMVITQSFQFLNKKRAMDEMELQQNRLKSSGDKGVSQIYDIEVALDMLMGGQISFGKHHLTIMGMSYDLEKLDELLSMINVTLTNTGGVGVRETINLEPAFWGQMPGNFDFLVRQAPIHTNNLAGYSSMHNYRSGKADGHYWGKATSILETVGYTPFYFNFHVNDVGHTAILGPTGAGKTVLMNFLCAQALRAKCRIFFFDKDRGAEIFIRALGGEYNAIDPGKECNFNPFQLEDTPGNRSYLFEFLKLLAEANGEPLNSDDAAILHKAIDGNYKLDYKDRTMRNVASFFGFQGPGTLANRMSMWFENGSHAKIFDNATDLIELNKNSIYGFEMAELLQNKAALSPVLSYIFHKINISLDGKPSVIVLDEAWALIDNEYFAHKIKDWLKVLRKLNTFVIFATQSVEDASKSSISDTLIQQTATQIFLPNLKATDAYMRSFMLSEREYELVKTSDPSSRFFLVKQGSESNLARINLSGMDEVINILSGRASTVRLLDDILQKEKDPNVWIPLFNEKIKQLKEEE